MPKKYYVDQRSVLNVVKVEKSKKTIHVKEYAGVPILGEIETCYDLYDSKEEALNHALFFIEGCIAENRQQVKELQKEIEQAEDRIRNNFLEKNLLKKQLKSK